MTKKRILLIALSVILVAALIASGTVLGKYIVRITDENAVSASSFYFESDYLKPSSESASYTVVGSNVIISLKNFSDASHVTSSNITYSVTVTNGTSSPASGTISSGSANIAALTITPTNSSNPVVVTASSTAPFAKSLTATFIFSGQTERTSASYLIEDSSGSDYATLKILAGNTIISAGTLSLTWDPSAVYLDPSNPYLAGSSGLAVGSLTIQQAIAPHSTAVIYVFKDDPTDNFSHSESSITSNTIAVTPAASPSSPSEEPEETPEPVESGEESAASQAAASSTPTITASDIWVDNATAEVDGTTITLTLNEGQTQINLHPFLTGGTVPITVISTSGGVKVSKHGTIYAKDEGGTAIVEINGTEYTVNFVL